MFQSYRYTKYLGHNKKTNKHSFQYEIIDSEFKEMGIEVEVLDERTMAIALAVAQAYQQRGYSDQYIAKQIFLLLLFATKKISIHIRSNDLFDQKIQSRNMGKMRTRY